MPANSSNIQTQCPSGWSGAWRHRFHRTDYYTSFTTIQVSQIHWTHRADYALVKLCLSWMPLRPALCASGACSIVALVPFLWNGTWAISQDSLSVQTLIPVFLWKVGITGSVVEQQRIRNFEEIKYLLVSVWDTIFPQYTKCLQSWKVINTTKHALHMFSKDLGIMDWAFLHAILWVKVSQGTSSNQDWLRMVALFETHPTRLVTHLTIILWPMSGHIIAWSCQLYEVWSNS